MVVSSFLTNIDICLLVKSKGVRIATSFAMLINKILLDLLDFLDIKLVVIHELGHQHEKRFFDFR